MDQLADLEPLEYYENHLKGALEANAEEYFDALVKKSGVDAEKNKETVARYNKEAAEAEAANKKVSSFKTVKTLLIVLAVAAFLAAVILIAVFATGGDSLLLVFGILCALLGVGVIVLLCTAVKKQLKARMERHKKELEEANAVLKEAYDQMAPLNALFTRGITRELALKTMPDLTLDEQLDMKRMDLFERKYGYDAGKGEMVSTVYLLSGTVEGSPFLFDRRLRRTMGTKTYTGSITIHWTTTETDSKGTTRTVQHSQVLTASVTKLAPYYTYETRLIYGNEGAPELHFSRAPQHSEQLTEKEREKKVKKGGKELKELTEKAVGKGKRFTELANTEFEVLFGAQDRDNEVEYRLMFTPLAQQNMLHLLTSKAGYGDDFYFRKAGMLNIISSEHAQNWLVDTDPSRYRSYDLAASRAAFISFNAGWFKSMYFDLAPVLAVPLYRMHRPDEFIYRSVYPSNYPAAEAEVLANRFPRTVFAHESSRTETILKAVPAYKRGTADSVSVTAYSFATENRTDYVSVFGGDGRAHTVPVPWVEYIPLERKSDMALKHVGGSPERFDRVKNDSVLTSFVGKFTNAGTCFEDGLLAFPLHKSMLTDREDGELDRIFGLKAAAAADAVLFAGLEALDAAEKELDRLEAADRKQAEATRAPADGKDGSAPRETAKAETDAPQGADGSSIKPNQEDN